MTALQEERRRAAILRVVELTTEAIDLIDAHDLPPQAAAHIDLGREKVRALLKP
jgi:hypothetical protein